MPLNPAENRYAAEISMTVRHLVLTLWGVAALAASRPSLAQGAGAEGQEALRTRMRDFQRAVVEDSSVRRIAEFFPRRADWSWVQFATDAPSGRPVREIWRFPATETLAAIGPEGPVCDAFVEGNSPEAYRLVSSLARALAAYRHWTQSGRRFAPRSGARHHSWRERIDNPGPPRGPWWYVEWMREDDRWVIAEFGEEGAYQEPQTSAGPILNPVTAHPRPERGLEGVRYAGQAPWYTGDAPIVSAGRRYHKYGLPRALSDSELERVGFRGEVPAYREAGTQGTPEVLYVLVSRGMYQPYQGYGDSCRP